VKKYKYKLFIRPAAKYNFHEGLHTIKPVGLWYLATKLMVLWHPTDKLIMLWHLDTKLMVIWHLVANKPMVIWHLLTMLVGCDMSLPCSVVLFYTKLIVMRHLAPLLMVIGHSLLSICNVESY